MTKDDVLEVARLLQKHHPAPWSSAALNYWWALCRGMARDLCHSPAAEKTFLLACGMEMPTPLDGEAETP